MKLLFVAMLFFTATAPLLAQSSIHIYSIFAKPGQTASPNCMAQVDILQRELQAFPHPDKWDYTIACEDEGWNDILKHEGVMVWSNNRRIYGLTSLAGHWTAFRGPTLVRPDEVAVTSERVIAHELAHIYLDSKDDSTVEKLAAQWIKERQAAPPTLVAASQ